MTIIPYKNNNNNLVRAVGWLSNEDNYPRGQVNDEFIYKIMTLCSMPANIRRSLHVCSLCRRNFSEYSSYYNYKDNEIICISNADVLVMSSEGIVYASPVQIYHYIRDHNYLPPNEFIRVIMVGGYEIPQKYLE
jgi:hypothetical protein